MRTLYISDLEGTLGIYKRNGRCAQTQTANPTDRE